MAEIRVVPRGKVYRQMFDAQVKLSMTLHNSRRSRAANAGVTLGDSASPPRCINASSLQGQRSDPRTSRSDDVRFSDWMSMAPRHSQKTDEETLPDIVVAEKLGSDINERLSERRLSKHKQAMAELEGDLAAVSKKFELFIKGTGETFLRKLSRCDENIERLVQKVDNISECDLCSLSLQDLHQLWDSVAQESDEQRKVIRELDRELERYDSDRTSRIAVILKRHSAALERISYLMLPDVHRLIDGEAMMINQAILANRRAVAKLIFHLMGKSLEKGLLFRLRYEQLVQDWTRLKLQASVEKFREFMSSPLILHPPGVQAALQSMRSAQEQLVGRRRTILQELSSMAPPKCSKALATECYSSLCAVDEHIDALHIDSIARLRSCYESSWQKCLAELQEFEEEVAKYGIPPEQVESIVKNELLPKIGQCQRQPEEQLVTMNRTFESLARRNAAVRRALLEFAKGAVHLWDIHGARLQKVEQQLQLCLENVRCSHQHQDQKKEAQLDVMLDELRQESSKETLKVTLEKVIVFLKDIKDGYNSLHQDEVGTVESYPALVLEEIRSYSSALTLFFGVSEMCDVECEDLQRCFPLISLDSRRLADMKTCSQTEGQRQSVDSSAIGHTEAVEYPQSPACLLFTEDSTDTEQEPSSPHVDTFTTSKGNVYHVSLSTRQWEEPEPPAVGVELVAYPSSLFAQMHRDVCVAFFNHVEEWYHTALSNTLNTVAARKEELRCEHELRLSLHDTRAQRIVKDVHDMRAEELVLHQERVNQHCRVVTEALQRSSTCLQDLIIQQEKQTEEFRAQVYSMEEAFNATTKSDVMLRLCDGLQLQLEKHTALIQAAHRCFRKETQSKMGALREANSHVVMSFRLFSEGGNFTAKETEVYMKQVGKMAKRVDSAEEALALDTDKNEYKCLEQAKSFVNKFLERFHVRASDLKFLEKIQRVLTNTQVQIKSEAILSNMQKKKLSDMLMELDRMVEACAAPTSAHGESNTVQVQELLPYVCSVNEELKKRFLYLDCSAEPRIEDPLPVLAQVPTGVVPSSAAPEGLLQPSQAGVAPAGDVALLVVRGLMQIGKSKVQQELQPTVTQKGLTAHPVTTIQQERGGPSRPAVDTPSKTSAEASYPQRMKRFSKPTRFDKRFHVFGSKPAEQDTPTFTGLIVNMLWKANDLLLMVAEEFYKKEQRVVSRLPELPETFQLCAEEANRRLLSYHNQAQEHHSGCVQEYRTQLCDFEERVARVAELLLSDLVEQHLEALIKDTEHLRHCVKLQLQTFNEKKREHHRQLSAHLTHPAFREELESLLLTEEECQKEEISAIYSGKRELQARVVKHGDEFVSALASLTENLLLQMDDLLTADEVQAALATEVKKETVTTLLRKKAGERVIEKPQTELVIRTWSGLCYLQPPTKAPVEEPLSECKRTVSLTPKKMSQAHLRTMEASEVAYECFSRRFQEELTRAAEEMEAQERQALCWQAEWQDSVCTCQRLCPA